MSALTPVDAASCSAMALECGRRASGLVKIMAYSAARTQIERARELTLLALKFEQEENSLPPATDSPAGVTPSPSLPGTNHESDGPKSRPGDAAASHTQIEQQLATGKTSAQERSSDRSGGQFGDAPKPATLSTAGA